MRLSEAAAIYEVRHSDSVTITRMESFWDFSVDAYRKPGVADACLSLQERHGLDVNVLLLCCWFGCTRGVLDEHLWERVLAFSGPWAENVVRPLRAARTWMKHTGCALPEISNDDCMSLREEIKRIELKAEQLQENSLQELAGDTAAKNLCLTSQIAFTSLNFNNYLHHISIELDAESRSRLAHIVAAAIEGATFDLVRDSMSATFQES